MCKNHSRIIKTSKIFRKSPGNNPKIIQNHRKWCQNRSQIDENGAQERPKSTKMMPRSVPKAALEASRFQQRYFGPALEFLVGYFGATWVILDAFWDRRGRQGGPKIDNLKADASAADSQVESC